MANFHTTRIKKSELDTLIEIVSDALGISHEHWKAVKKYLEKAGISNIRTVRDGNKITGGMLIINWK